MSFLSCLQRNPSTDSLTVLKALGRRSASISRYGAALIALWALLPCAGIRAQNELLSSTLRISFNAGQSAETVALSPDGKWGAVGTGNGGVGVFSLAGSGQPQWVAHQKKRVEVLAFDRTSTMLAAAGEDGVIDLVDLASNRVRELNGHHKKVWALAFSPDGQYLASGGDDKEIIVWEASSGAELFRLNREGARSLIYLGFNGLGTTLMSADMSGVFSEWDVKTRMRLRQIKESDNTIQSAAGSFSGEFLAVNTELSALTHGVMYREDRIKLYDTGKFQVAKTLDNLNGEISSISLSADNRYVAMGLFVRTRVQSYLSVFDVTRGVEVVSLPATRGNVISVAFSADGQSLVSGADNGDVRLYAMKGIQPGAAVGDLAGLKYKVTTSQPGSLIPANANLTIGVMEMDANGVDPGTAHAVAELLQTSIAANSSVTLVERSRMDQIIHEQNFQFSNRADPGTATRLGQLLGARKMIFGSVSKLGTSMTIHTAIVDVETGKIDGSCEVICQQCAGEDLPVAVAKLKQYLVADSR
jgi:WD40 repeat protein